jgi:hypothetical protein
MIEKARVYLLLDAQCSRACTGCFLESQRELPKREYTASAQGIHSLVSQGFSVRVTGSDLVRYESIGDIAKACGQDYLLGDVSALHQQGEALIAAKKGGINKIFITSPLSSNVSGDVNLESAVESVRSAGMQPILSYVLGQENIHGVEGMIEECLRLRVVSMRFLRYMPPPGGDAANFISDDTLPGFLAAVNQLRQAIPRGQLNIHVHGHFGTWFRLRHGQGCLAGEELFIVGLDNKVYPCEFLMHPQFELGRLDGETLVINKRLKGLREDDCKYKQIFVDGKRFAIERC